MPEHKLKAVIEALRGEFGKVLGDRLRGMVMYGSQARGEARPDSDIDVLVIIRGELDYGVLIRQTSEAVSAISLRYDVVVSRAFVSEEQFFQSQTPFLLNVRREGVQL
jgi:predicted nucleotidyltransferase